MIKLIKLSAPGWEKEFNTEDEARVELYKHICNTCREGDKAYDLGGELVYESDPVNENSSLDDLLCTSCGCEYDVERSYYTICFPGEFGQSVQETWSEEQIIKSYYTHWCTKMIENVPNPILSKELCIADWVTVHWAQQTNKWGVPIRGDE